MQKQSERRGKIGFDTKESALELDDKGKVISVTVKQRGFAEEMIEECMIQANVCVANVLHSNQLPCMYRVHEKPDPERILEVCNVANTLRVPFSFYPDDASPKDLQKFLESIENEENQFVLSMVTLRAMQKAKYDNRCLGHYGLALDEYCHFTSPIRRYSDLVVHRMLRRYIFTKDKKNRVSKDDKKIEKQAFHISQKERDAIYVERLITDYKKAEYMQNHIGHVYQANIVGVQSFGFFVQMENTIEGLVPVHTLDDYYTYDAQKTCLVSKTGKTYMLGQRVKVVCTDVNIQKGQVEFALVRR